MLVTLGGKYGGRGLSRDQNKLKNRIKLYISFIAGLWEIIVKESRNTFRKEFCSLDK